MKRVLFVLPSFKSGGAEKVTLTIIRLLDSSEYDKHVAVLDNHGKWRALLPETATLHDLKVSRSLHSFGPLYRLVQHIKPDYVFSSLARILSLLVCVKWLSRHRFKLCSRVQSMPSLEKKYCSYGHVKRLIYTLTYRYSDKVIVQTKEMGAEVKSFFKVPIRKIHELPNPVDTMHINDCIRGSQNPFPVHSDWCFVASGRLSNEKGFDVLICAFARFLKKYPNAKLYILGRDAGEGGCLAQLIMDLQLKDRVFLVGDKSNPYPYYYYADCFVLSSRWEGCPNALLEFMYLNKPVVASRCIPFISKVVKEGENGFTFQVGSVEDLEAALCAIRELQGVKIDNSIKLPYTNSLDRLFD